MDLHTLSIFLSSINTSLSLHSRSISIFPSLLIQRYILNYDDDNKKEKKKKVKLGLGVGKGRGGGGGGG